MPGSEIENIRKSVDIVDIIKSYIPLSPKGKSYVALCPFHEKYLGKKDGHASMSISQTKQVYKCFSCGATGNVFTFVEEYENVSFLEAVKIVAEKSGLVFKGKINTTKKEQLIYKDEYEVMDLAVKFYQNNLNSNLGKPAKEYLKQRSLTEQTVKTFDLGLSLNYNYSLTKYLINKKYKLDTLIKLSLTNKSGNDMFYDRIMFPIHDFCGNPVGFTARVYNKSSTNAKYVNSSESNIFKKGSIFFNYHRAINDIKKEKTVILVEGNMDAIRMYDSGFKNVIALMGTNITKEQINILKNLRSKIILMFDNDEAGEVATYKNGTLLEESNIEVLVIRLSGEKDPDSYIIKNGVDAMALNITKPTTFLNFKLRYLKKNRDLSDTKDLVDYINDLIDSLKNIEDDLTKEVILKKISKEYDISYNLLKEKLEKSEKITKNGQNSIKKVEKKIISKYDKAVRNIIYFMINDFKYIDIYQKEIGYFEERKYRDIANEIVCFYEINKEISEPSFISYVQTKEICDELMDIIRDNKIRELGVDTFFECIKVLKSEDAKKKIKKLKKELTDEFDSNKKILIAEEIIKLKKGCVENER